MTHTNQSTVQSPGKATRFPRGLVAALLCILLLVGAGGVGGTLIYRRFRAVASIVSVDVNPSVELRANQKGKVLSCTALNADAAAVLTDMNGGADLEGTTLPVAVNAVVGALLRGGYLDGLSSAILLSVEDKDADRAARLQQTLVAAVDGVLKSASNNSAVLSQSLNTDADLNSRAEQNHISSGKAYLIDRILQKNGKLNFSELSALSVEELRDLLEAGAPDMPVGTDAALKAVLEYAGVAGNTGVTSDVDSELDEVPPHYDIEIRFGGNEYEYRVDAFTASVLSGPKNITGSATASSETASAPNPNTAPSASDSGAASVQGGNTASSTPAESRQPGTGSESNSFPDTGTSPSSAVTTPSSQNTGTASVQGSQSGDIGAEAAKAAALRHAGLTAGEITRLRAERDMERGRAVYEIDFSKGRIEYEYTIDAATGEVLEHDRDFDD